MKAQYRNAIKTKALIRKTVIDLMNKNRNISDITVSEIVKAANINRGTFYNHYASPIDVLEEMKIELMKEFSMEIKTANINRDLDSFVDFIIDHCKKNETDYKKIIKGIPMSTMLVLRQQFINELKKINLNIDEFTLHILVNGLIGLYFDFIRGSINTNYDKLSKNLKKFLHHCINE